MLLYLQCEKKHLPALAGVAALALSGCNGAVQSSAASEPVSSTAVLTAPAVLTSATASAVAPNASTSSIFETLACPEGLVGVFQLQNGQLESRQLLGGKDGQCAITNPVSGGAAVIVKPYGILPYVVTDTAHMSLAIAETVTNRTLGEYKMSGNGWKVNIVINSIADVKYTINQKTLPALKIDTTNNNNSGRVGSLSFTFVLPTADLPYLVYVETSNPRGYVSSPTEHLVNLSPMINELP